VKPRPQISIALAALLGALIILALNFGLHPGSTPKSAPCCPIAGGLELQSPELESEPVTPNQAVPSVIVYYFHGTARCDTCLLIEALSQSVVESQFSDDVAANRITFMTVDYDLPENAHFVTDYQLPCPSPVLVRQSERGQEDWMLLGDAWSLVDEPALLMDYVRTKVSAVLESRTRPSLTTSSGLRSDSARH
jgi:hypothetical protein